MAHYLTYEELVAELQREGLCSTGNREELELMVTQLWGKALNPKITIYPNARIEEEDNDNRNIEPPQQNTADEEETSNIESCLSELSKLPSLIASLIGNKSKSISIRDIENSISEFSGDDAFSIRKWILEFENAAVIMKWNDMEKLVYAKKQLVGTAKLFIRGMSLSSYAQLKTSLLAEFDKQLNSVEVHDRLRKRVQNRNETFHQYMLHMREIARAVDVDQASVIKYIINGVGDKPENKTLLYGATSFAELREKYQLYEEFKQTVKTDSNLTTNKYKQDDKQKSQRFGSSRMGVQRCFNCGSNDHKRADCKSDTKCFKCGENGHMSPKCPKAAAQVKIIHSTSMQKEVKVNGMRVTALIDTGSDVTLLRENVYHKIGNKHLSNHHLSLFGFTNEKCKTKGSFKVVVAVDSVELNGDCHVVDNKFLGVDCIIGKDLILQAVLRIDHQGVTFYKEQAEDDQSDDAKIMQIRTAGPAELDVPFKYRDEIEKVVEQYEPKPMTDYPVQMSIVLTDDVPIYSSARRLPFAEQDIVRNQVDEWLIKGIITKSSSEYCSPVVVVRKKDGSPRVCIDYRRINTKILRDHFPVPLIDEQLDRLQGARVFSTLDLKDEFFHVPIAESSRKFTSFVTAQGQYEFTKVPFGLSSSPSVFLRFINNIFSDLIRCGFVSTYMDDLIVVSPDEKEAIFRLKAVLIVAAENNLQINWKKCQFIQRRVQFLGHIIEEGTVKPSEEKIVAVKKFPEPNTFKKVQSFLGLTGYFRKFIHQYSIIARPLSNLLKKDAKFNFGKEERIAFESLKTALTSEPVLHIYERNAPIELHTDASQLGYGAILMQKFSDGLLHPVQFMSRKTTPADQKLHSYYLEVKAIYIALIKFRVYLLGTKFKIVTDCAAFQCTIKKNELPLAVTRWVMHFQEFCFEVEHRSGNRMRHVDALSRCFEIYAVDNQVLERIRKAQADDEGIEAIKTVLLEKPYGNFSLKQNLLFKRIDDRDLLVIPNKMQKEIIKIKHEEGHFGVAKVEYVVSRDFFIPKLKQKIEEVIHNCVKCILTNRKAGKQEGLLHPIDKGVAPLHTLHLDHLGPMDLTTKQYRYILSIIDSFSKFAWLYPTKTLTAEEFIRRLEERRSYFGSPSRVVTDRGTAFTANVFQEYCVKENIEHILTTTGVPRGNGQVERLNAVVINVLTKLTIDSPSKWYQQVGHVQRVINCSFQRAIQRCPFEVMFGIKPNSNSDLNVQALIDDEVLKCFDEERDKIRLDARTQISKIQQENIATYDKKRKKELVYSVGDLVAIKRTQFGSGQKLVPEFMGPYEVTRVGRYGRYNVKRLCNGDGPKQTLSSVDFMKPWVDSISDSDQNTSPESEVEQDGRV